MCHWYVILKDNEKSYGKIMKVEFLKKMSWTDYNLNLVKRISIAKFVQLINITCSKIIKYHRISSNKNFIHLGDHESSYRAIPSIKWPKVILGHPDFCLKSSMIASIYFYFFQLLLICIHCYHLRRKCLTYI